MLTSSPTYTVEKIADAILIRCDESFVLDHEHEFAGELNQLIRETNSRSVVVDFRCVGACSSSFLNSLLQARKQLLTVGGTVKLCCLGDSMREKLLMLRLIGKVFNEYESVSEAVESLD